jgi:putative phosphoesterase
MLVGVISDTHGLVRPEVHQAFTGVDLILHGGDIGSAEVMDALKAVAPVVAVRGNNDTGEWANAIPETEIVQVDDASIFMLHNLKEIDVKSGIPKVQAVVSGHSHKPSIECRAGVLFVNPGSAGPRRFKLPITVARLTIHGSNVNGEIVELLR